MRTVKTIFVVIAMIAPALSWSQTTKTTAASSAKKDLRSEFSTLGDNNDVVERVKNMDSNQKVRVVQNRIVDRNHRIELAGNYAFTGGGDAYVKTQNLGAILEYHINPRWSLGLQYLKAYNALSSEGERILANAKTDQAIDKGSQARYPGVDYPLDSQLATVSFYPINGKMNLFDLGISQFDIYLQLGYGKINLYEGNASSDLLSVGVGSGFWLSQRFTSRLEVRYQQYEDLLLSDKRKQNTLQALASIGILVW